MISQWAGQRGALEASLLGPGLPPLWTFTRASSGTQINSGVLSTASTNVARFETSPAGYLGEPQATNQLKQSNDLSNAVWTQTGTPGLTGGQIGPDGAATAWSIAISTANTIYQGAPSGGPAGTRYEPSFWINPVSGSGTTLLASPYPLKGQWTITYASLSAGWQRITRSHPAVTVDVEFIGEATVGFGGIQLKGGTGSCVYIVADFQAEMASFSTSYIATTTTVATRAADNLTLDLTQLPGLQTATGYGVAMDFSVISNGQGNTVVLGASIGADGNNAWYIITDGGGGLRVVSIVGGVSQPTAYLPMRTAGLTNRLALSVTPSGIRWTMNGAAVVGLTNAGQPAMTTMAVGRLPYAAGNYTNMHATLVTLTPGPQSDAALIARAY